jgi:hypothetical protein
VDPTAGAIRIVVVRVGLARFLSWAAARRRDRGDPLGSDRRRATGQTGQRSGRVDAPDMMIFAPGPRRWLSALHRSVRIVPAVVRRTCPAMAATRIWAQLEECLNGHEVGMGWLGDDTP